VVVVTTSFLPPVIPKVAPGGASAGAALGDVGDPQRLQTVGHEPPSETPRWGS
jgi:hypothetical protein